MSNSSVEVPVWGEPALLKRVLGKSALKNRLLTLFLQELPPKLLAIDHAMGEKNLDALVASSHAVKGMAGTVSAMRLQACMAEIERAAREGELDRALRLHIEVQSLADEVVAAFERAL